MTPFFRGVVLAAIVPCGALADSHAAPAPFPVFDRSLQGGGLFVDDPLPDPLPPPPPDPDELRQGGEIFFQARLPGSLRMRWQDRTDAELGYTVRRAHVGAEFSFPGPDDWENIADLAPQDDFVAFTDSGLVAEDIYCYRAEVFDVDRRLPGTVHCARAALPSDFQIFRAVLGVKVADIADAGTDNAVEVGLNSRALVVPFGNRTWLKYSRNDLERGSFWRYDLDLRGLTVTHDVTQIDIRKSGSDDLCIERVTLDVNGRPYFEQDFSGEPAGCVWINAGSEDRLVIPFSALRDHQNWGRFQPVNLLSRETIIGLADGNAVSPVMGDSPVPIGQDITLDFSADILGLRHDDLRSRVESVIGNAIKDIELPAGRSVEWVMPSGGAESSVILDRAADDRIAVSFDLKVPIPASPDIQIDGAFDLVVGFACGENNVVRFSIQAENIVIDADTPLGLFEGTVQDRIDSQTFNIPPISQTLSLADLPGDREPPTCHAARLVITPDADVLATLILRSLLRPDADEPGPATGDDLVDPPGENDGPDIGPADPDL